AATAGSCSPVGLPRRSHGPTRTSARALIRFTFQESAAVHTPSPSPSRTTHTGVATGEPFLRKLVINRYLPDPSRSRAASSMAQSLGPARPFAPGARRATGPVRLTGSRPAVRGGRCPPGPRPRPAVRRPAVRRPAVRRSTVRRSAGAAVACGGAPHPAHRLREHLGRRPEVQPGVPLPSRAERRAGVEGDPALLQEDARRVVAEAEGTAVEPGQVGGGAGAVADPGQ